jgi:hypothetical protein
MVWLRSRWREGIVGYLYMKHQSRQKRIEIIHQERMAAMEKGIPLPEFPLEPERERRPPDPTGVLPILGTVLLSLSVGTMIVLYLTLEAASHGFGYHSSAVRIFGRGPDCLPFLEGRAWALTPGGERFPTRGPRAERRPASLRGTGSPA